MFQARAKTTMMDNLSCDAYYTFIKSNIHHHHHRRPHSHYAQQHFSFSKYARKYYIWFFLLGGGHGERKEDTSYFLTPDTFREKYVSVRIYIQRISMKRALRER